MNVDQAKEIILKATEDGSWVERANSREFVRVGKQDFKNSELFEALEHLCDEGVLEQIPSAGQSRTSVGFRRTKIAL